MNSIKDTFEAACAHHDAGRLAEAEAGYRRVLADAPGNAVVLHLLGIVAHQGGDSQQASLLIAEACERAPDNAEFARDLGLVLAADGNRAEAEAQFQRALVIEPDDPSTRLQLASLHHQAGEPGAALEHYRLALKRLPNLADLHNQIGVCYLQLGDEASAKAAFTACLAQDAGHRDARENMGRALLQTGSFDEAEAQLRALLADEPERDEAWHLLGFVRLQKGDVDDAAQAFLTPVRGRFAPGTTGGAPPADAATTTRTKLLHDIQQLEYLDQRGLMPGARVTALLDSYRKALQVLPPERDNQFFFDTPQVDGFGDVFNRLHHEWEAPKERGAAANPSLDHGAITATFQRDGWAVCDDFLSEGALAGLQRFCTEPTIWFEKKFRNEVGTSLRNGFCCPLLLQVAQEIRQAFPDVFGQHLFTGCFTYKYFQHGSVGHAHADRGAVSLNLWITPDAANLDPERGGLVIWNKRVPSGYFRAEPEEIDGIHHRLVNAPDARQSVIPYRCNRATLFRCDVLHASDRMRFREGYADRRVSVTFLYGRPGD